MKVSVQHMGEAQYEIRCGAHTMYSDQPESNGGYDEAMTPPEIFLGALGACAAYYAVDYLKRQKLAYEGTRVEAHAEKLKAPARLGAMVLQVTPPSLLSAEHRTGLDAAVGRCILHNTLTHSPEIRTEIAGGAEVVEPTRGRAA